MEANTMDAQEPLSGLTRDLLVEVLSRVDGPTLASAACACESLRGAAKEEILWEELCRSAWPSSTMDAGAKGLVSSMPGGFAKLYADSLPDLLYRPCQEGGGRHVLNGAGEPAAASLGLVSFVDVYYKKKCVLSRVVHGFPVDDLAAGSAGGAGGEETGAPPSIPLEPKEEGGVGVLNWTLEEDLTLSWVLVDVKRGRAVNLSSGKPVGVQRSGPGGVVVRFGCAVPVERQLLASGVAECIISMWYQVSYAAEEEDSNLIRCTEIELQVEDAEGGRLDGNRSLAVLGRALCSRTRTRNRRAVEEGYRAYQKDRRAARERKMRKLEGVTGKLCALSGMAVFLGLCAVMF